MAMAGATGIHRRPASRGTRADIPAGETNAGPAHARSVRGDAPSAQEANASGSGVARALSSSSRMHR